MSTMLESLMGGNKDDGDRAARRAERQARRSMRDNPELQQQAQSFHARHVDPDPNVTNAPGDIWQMFQQVQHDATPDQMQTALQQTVDNMTPEQRDQLGKLLQQSGQHLPAATAGAAAADGGGLMGMLQGALGSGAPAQAEHGGSVLDTIFGHGNKPAVAAPAQPAPQPAAKDDESLFPGFLDNPLAKVLIGGIAAYGAKQVSDAFAKQQGQQHPGQ